MDAVLWTARGDVCSTVTDENEDRMTCTLRNASGVLPPDLGGTATTADVVARLIEALA